MDEGLVWMRRDYAPLLLKYLAHQDEVGPAVRL